MYQLAVGCLFILLIQTFYVKIIMKWQGKKRAIFELAANVLWLIMGFLFIFFPNNIKSLYIGIFFIVGGIILAPIMIREFRKRWRA